MIRLPVFILILVFAVNVLAAAPSVIVLGIGPEIPEIAGFGPERVDEMLQSRARSDLERQQLSQAGTLDAMAHGHLARTAAHDDIERPVRPEAHAFDLELERAPGRPREQEEQRGSSARSS